MNLLLAFLAGPALHVSVFRRGEWHLYGRDIIVASLLLNIGLTAVLHSNYVAESWWLAFKTATSLEFAAMAGFLTSMLVYRAWFHALCKYPGPFVARLSDANMVRLSSHFQLYKEVQKLHEQHGDIVRLGPSTLSIAKPEAVMAIHGPKSKCSKGPWYDHAQPMWSLHADRNTVTHAAQRASWERGLNSAALRDYNPVVTQTTQALVEKIHESQGKAFDASKWLNLFSFEVMGWMAFGQSFDLMATGKKTYFMELIQQSMDPLGTVGHMTWAYQLIKNIPAVSKALYAFKKWLRAQLISQMEKPTEFRTLFSTILEDYPKYNELTERQRNLLEGDLFLIVVAGSDTVAATLLNLLQELSTNPSAQKKLQEEIDAHFAENDEADPGLLSKLEYLQACINETLRLWPPVMSGTQRLTPPEGLQIGDELIPGDTIVQIPTYVLHRNKDVYPRPNEFIPERWTTKPELIQDRSVFHPFSVGKYNCVGKQLALIEIRQVASEILKRYDVALAPGFTTKDYQDALKDHFTLDVGKLNLTFKAR